MKIQTRGQFKSNLLFQVAEYKLGIGALLSVDNDRATQRFQNTIWKIDGRRYISPGSFARNHAASSQRKPCLARAAFTTKPLQQTRTNKTQIDKGVIPCTQGIGCPDVKHVIAVSTMHRQRHEGSFLQHNPQFAQGRRRSSLTLLGFNVYVLLERTREN